MITINKDTYNEFCRKFMAGVWPGKRFGQAFYDEFLVDTSSDDITEDLLLYDKIYNATPTSYAKRLISLLVKRK